jgi:pyruvate dehydrogenase E1 component alpha subunit
MPREEIDLPYRIEYLSILDENGRLDEALEPDIPDDLLLKMYRFMLLSRRFDERLLNLQRQGRIGTFAPSTGHEAAYVGSVAALKPTDWLVPSYRETAALLWRGGTMENFLLYFGGYDEAGWIPEEIKNLPISIPVGSQMQHAVGLGWAIKYRQSNEVVMTYFGDGATSQGDFHEAMNFAGVFQTPVVFVCQNNQWAISVPRSKQTHSKTLAQKGLAYDIPGIQVDGNDVLAVYASAKEALDRARLGGGPTLIEYVTYRLVMHTTADDPKRYRTDADVEKWMKRDPIPRFQNYLTEKGILTSEKIEELEREVKKDIQESVERAEKRMKEPVDPLHMFEHMYAELPPAIQEQREELIRELAADKGESSHA